MDFALSLPTLLILLTSSAAAGFLSGLCGIGGGVVFVPALIIVFTEMGFGPYVMHMAVGTSLIVMVPTGLSSARSHAKKGAFNKRAFFNWLPGIIAGVFLGTYLASILDGESLKTIFAIAICFLAALMWIDPKRLKERFSKSKDIVDIKPVSEEPKITENPPSKPVLSSFGAGVGCLSSLMGIGGATMTVPAMTLLGMNIRESVATASAVGMLISLPAALGFMIIGQSAQLGEVDSSFIIGYVHFLVAAIMLPISIIFTKLGVYVAHKVALKNLKQIFSFFMVFIAARMLWNIYG